MELFSIKIRCTFQLVSTINSYKNQNNYSVNEKKSGDFLFLCFDFNYL